MEPQAYGRTTFPLNDYIVSSTLIPHNLRLTRPLILVNDRYTGVVN